MTRTTTALTALAATASAGAIVLGGLTAAWATEPPETAPPLATLVYVGQPLDPDQPFSFRNSGPQTLDRGASGEGHFTPTVALPCGYGAQVDYTQGLPLANAPETITPPTTTLHDLGVMVRWEYVQPEPCPVVDPEPEPTEPPTQPEQPQEPTTPPAPPEAHPEQEPAPQQPAPVTIDPEHQREAQELNPGARYSPVELG